VGPNQKPYDSSVNEIKTMKTVDLNPYTILIYYILYNTIYQHGTNSAYIAQNKKLNKDKQKENKKP